MWWKRIGRLLGRRDPDAAASGESVPGVEWIDGGENPWGVPVLNVRPITHGMLSASSDIEHAQNMDSMYSEDGTVFVGQAPREGHNVDINLRFPTDGFLADGILFNPEVMEHRWALYYYQQQIILVQCWTREVVAVASTRMVDGDLMVTVIRGSLIKEDESPAFTARVLDYLVRSHALKLDYPAPLPAGMEQDATTAGQWCFSKYGNRASYATHHEVPLVSPERPLRTKSLLYIAAQHGDRQVMEAQLDAGVPIDVFAQDGMTALHASVVQDDVTVAELLMERGCPVDVRSVGGVTPMMVAVQMQRVAQVTHLLDHGADVNAASAKGFTTLHRAAEMGNIDLVRLLLDRGAAPHPEAQGHTPRSLAESRGETAIVQLLDAQ